MNEMLWRVGTTYIPVTDPGKSADWFVKHLGATIGYSDDDKAIINLANQSFFLVKSPFGQTSNFVDIHGNQRFSMTFEVDGDDALVRLNQQLHDSGVKVNAIEDRGHAGRNFVFYDPDGNAFDVWSELSPVFKEKFAVTSK